MIDCSDTPAGIIARLDDALSRRGENCVLRRVVKRSGSPVNSDVTVRASVKAVAGTELAGTTKQTRYELIISPTQILAAPWPGTDETPYVSSSNVNQSIPKVTDTVFVQGRECQVLAPVKPMFIAGVWVRCELVVAG